MTLRPLSLLLLVACGAKDVPPSEPPRPAGDEQAAFAKAKPVFDKFCSPCHTSKGAKTSAKKLEHFNMDTYPFGGHHAAEIGATIREVLGVTGKEPTMPLDDPGAVKGAELEAIVDWSHAFDRAHPGEHEHHHAH